VTYSGGGVVVVVEVASVVVDAVVGLVIVLDDVCVTVPVLVEVVWSTILYKASLK
jgi:hypothetical protein